MKRKRMSRSQRKFIRREKARIRRQVLSLAKRDEEIKKLYQKPAAAPAKEPVKEAKKSKLAAKKAKEPAEKAAKEKKAAKKLPKPKLAKKIKE